MNIVSTCPLGSKCEEIKDNQVHRCKWYMEMDGEDARGVVHNHEFKCVMEWQIVMMMEQARAGMMHTNAILQQTNESSSRQDLAIQTMLASARVQSDRNKINVETINN